MYISNLDILIVVIFLGLILGIGLMYTRSASKDTRSFFLGGRNIPWWIAGTSMVATTFAADTPLLITEIVANNGISGNWIWWNGLIGGMLTTFFFARYWQKANIITDVELSELRYTGTPARFLRGFKALYLGVLLNSVIIAWVNIALGSLLVVFFDIPSEDLLYYYFAAMLLVAFYSSLSGLLGVAMTDFIQFLVAMTGTLVLAYLVIQSEKIGGIVGLKAKLPAETFHFLPQINFSNANSIQESSQVLVIGLSTFLSYIGFQWWASWYPGAEPGGGGYAAQRMMSTPQEKDATKASLLFQILHYAIRPLPWILVALSAIYLYPDLAPEDKKLGYVLAMREFLPEGLRGLLLASFLAAYMSTISTQLNWGSSYIINDFYQRFIQPQASQKQLVLASRVSTLILMLVALFVTSQTSTLEGAFKFMINAGAGLGAVLILRWYWWRINAWSEISATIAPFIGYGVASYWAWNSTNQFFFTVAFTSFTWLLVTFLTKPTAHEHLVAFYRRIEPPGAWKPIREASGIPKKPSPIPVLLGATLSAILLAFSVLFFSGELLFMEWNKALIYAGVAGVSLLSLSYFAKKAHIF